MIEKYDEQQLKELLNGEDVDINFSDSISEEDLVKSLSYIYDYENSLDIIPNIRVLLKGINIDKLSVAIKYSLDREDLKDPLMLLNIMNLIKSGLKLNEYFFKDENIYISSITDLLNLKLKIKNELEMFIQKMSVHFVALFKSYNKLTFTPLDKHIQLPNIYRNLFLSSDLLTLSGIFSLSKPFNTDECVYIENSCTIISQLLMKSSIGISLLSDFLRNEDDNRNREEDNI